MTNRFEAARKFAADIVKRQGLTPPIDPMRVISKMGIEVTEKANNFGIEAYSSLSSAPSITLNSELTFAPRRNFTLAHELGHIVIPWHNGDVRCNTDEPFSTLSGRRLIDTQELEANIFASELLMPAEWLSEQINCYPDSFQDCLYAIKEKANTSVMACFYALERALPSGSVFYVGLDGEDFLRRFAAYGTPYGGVYGSLDDNIAFMRASCERAEEFHVSQYYVAYFKLLTLPDAERIKKEYHRLGDIAALIDSLSEGRPIRAFNYMKYLLDTVDCKYYAQIFYKQKLLRKYYSYSNARFKLNDGDTYETFVTTLTRNGVKFSVCGEGDYKAVFVKDTQYEIGTAELCEPNALLDDILVELYADDAKQKRMRINGIIGSINSLNKTADAGELYNEIKARFSGDTAFVEFYNHPMFDKYVINKITRMIETKIKK